MSKSPKGLSSAIAKWTLILAENYRVALSPTLPEIWGEALKDMSVDQFELACAVHLRSSRFFPTVADIRLATLAQESERNLLDAEIAWERVLGIADEWYINEDTREIIPKFHHGKFFYPPKLTEVEDYASRQIGGLWAIRYRNPDKTFFLRRDFIQAFRRYVETRGLKQLPGEVCVSLQAPVRKLIESGWGKMPGHDR